MGCAASRTRSRSLRALRTIRTAADADRNCLRRRRAGARPRSKGWAGASRARRRRIPADRMATLSALRTDLRNWTATFANPAVLPDSVCDSCINAAFALMQEAHLWRGQETTSVTLVYPAGAESIALPADFVSQKAVYQETAASRVPLAYIEKTRRDDFIRGDSPISG